MFLSKLTGSETLNVNKYFLCSQITSYSFSYDDWYSVLHLSQLDLPIISVNKASIIKELSLFFPPGFFQ